MPDKPHVCLLVDNPLRDLEGLVLLGWQLAAKGATVTLVPMYEQGFDVPALRPDLVLRELHPTQQRRPHQIL